MKAMIFAAGTGSRLKPLTDHTPKALIPIGGKPMLEHVILKLKSSGFDQIVINIHHLGNQIVDFLEANNNFGVRIEISDESDYLLDTGGGIKKATSLLCGNEPFLIHNVDILSNVDLKKLYDTHVQTNPLATLLVTRWRKLRYIWPPAPRATRHTRGSTAPWNWCGRRAICLFPCICATHPPS